MTRVLALLLLVACGQPTQAPSSPPSEPTGDPSAQTACAGDLGNLPGAVTLSAGVTQDTGDRAAAIASAEGWRMPEGVTFAVGEPRVAGDVITIRGELVNTTTASQDVLLSEAGAGYFAATLVGDLVRRPAPPADPGLTPRPVLSPEPHRFTLAPGARWPLETSVTLACWELDRPRTVTLHWWLHVQGEVRQGELQVALR